MHHQILHPESDSAYGLSPLQENITTLISATLWDGKGPHTCYCQGCLKVHGFVGILGLPCDPEESLGRVLVVHNLTRTDLLHLIGHLEQEETTN